MESTQPKGTPEYAAHAHASTVRYFPKIDRLFWLITLPTVLITLGGLVVSAFEPPSLLVMVPTAFFIFYFLFSPLFGYAELGESKLVIKYGFFLKKEIEYASIRGAELRRKVIAESMMSLKCAVEEVLIRYNRFDVTVISVKENSVFIKELYKRCGLDSKGHTDK